jgi:hypothetical protein
VGYVIACYGLVLGTLLAYSLHLTLAQKALRKSLSPHGNQIPVDKTSRSEV